MVAGACTRQSELPRHEQTIDGMTVYVGVMPAEIVQGYATEGEDPAAMHGGKPRQPHAHHIVVALFDSTTGMRISDAKVRARVTARPLDHAPDQSLEPMQIAGTTTYGNFFPMAGRGPWRIHLEIERPGASHPSAVDFVYEHLPD